MCSDSSRFKDMKGKILILSAPSGTGKSTIISRLREDARLNLDFSVSATSRSPRGQEKDGKDYYFISREQFDEAVRQDKFVEWEEVYAGTCYGTLKSEVERITDKGHNLIMDIDVKGALNVKKCYGPDALSIFIMPPSLDELGRRLRSRATDPEETIRKRLDKADFEIGFASQFDHTVVNDNLDKAVEDVRSLILDFIE